MQIVDVGRNEPCPCGSGRKYKKCCLAAQDVAVAGGAAELDVAALVDRALAEDAWAVVNAVFEPGFKLFAPGQPLEHVRFRDDQISATVPEPAALTRMCGNGWLRRCEREICDVLDRYELELPARDGLRLAVHVLRRFGATSALVRAIAELQTEERAVRVRAYRDALATRGIAAGEIGTGWTALFDWFERDRPTVLLFADWFAIRMAAEDELEALWQTSIASRLCDRCLHVLAQPEVSSAREYLQLAGVALLRSAPRIATALAHVTPPQMLTDDERMVHEVLTTRERDERWPGAIARIAEATEARGDYAGAALLREARQRLQARRR